MKHSIKIWEAVDFKKILSKRNQNVLNTSFTNSGGHQCCSPIWCLQHSKTLRTAITPSIFNCKLSKNFYTEYFTWINLLNEILEWVKWLNVQNIWATETVNQDCERIPLKAALSVCADKMNQVTFTLIFHLASLY